VSRKALSKHSHPYIPNSLLEIKQEMMREIGIKSLEELYEDVPQRYHLKEPLKLPEPLSEFELKKHVETLLSKNKTCDDMPGFLGAGCWQHYVPAVVKELCSSGCKGNRSTQRTAYFLHALPA